MPIKLEAQVAEVSGALGSVYQICRAGNRICFDESGGVIVNMQSGRAIPIKQNKGSYEMDLWMPAAQGENQDIGEMSDKQIQADGDDGKDVKLEGEKSSDDEISMDFIRQGE